MTDGTVQAARHAAKAALSGASGVLVGRPGLSLDEQIANLEKALEFVSEAESALNDALDVVEGRAADAPAASEGSADEDLVAKITAAVLAALGK